ncbi:MAG: DeoR/GlpR family DNA-binding transcription regulator [Niameybacter sp.]
MLAIERQRAILEKLQEDGAVRVVDLSKLFQVTEETVRRDLDKLEKKRLLQKTYGGAVALVEEDQEGEEYSFDDRVKQNLDGKAKIGKAIAAMIQAREILMVDSSTTCLEVLKYIEEDKKLTVITNGLGTMMQASKMSHINLIGTGGTYREKSISFVGPTAKNNILSYYADKAILSCKGISKERGVMESSEFEAEIKQGFIECAKEVVLAVDHQKVDKSSIHRLVGWENINYIVTDKALDEEWLVLCKQYDIKLIVAE